MIGLWFSLVIVLIAIAYMLLARACNKKVAHFCVSAIPIALYILVIMFGNYLERVLGDEALGLMLAVLLTSVSLGLVGVVLTVGAFRRRESRVGFLMATLLAYLPFMLN